MSWHNYQVSSHGKWILAGEHAVLRGIPALVFPLASRHFSLHYRVTSEPLSLRIQSTSPEEYKKVFSSLLEIALVKAGTLTSKVHGELELSSTIPVGGGLGASAALCVSVTRWLSAMGLVAEEAQNDFARELENVFHGESSGADISVVLSKNPLIFTRHQPIRTFMPKWHPQLHLSYSGVKGVTSDCVSKVKRLQESKPGLALEIDQQMKKSVEQAQEALLSDAKRGFALLKEALDGGQRCFEAWDLVSPQARAEIDRLKAQGAAAVKMTGSGHGGYILSLWKDKAPSGDFISCF